MKIGVIIQARMGSSRLPGKVMKQLSEKEVLWHVVERLKHSKYLNSIIVATTNKMQDDIIADFCTKHEINYYRGDEQDVLKRYYEAAKESELDIIVRVTSDCPLIDPTVVDQLVATLIREKADYISNSFESTYARGLECSAFTFEALEKCMNEAVKDTHREHVVLYMRENTHLFNTLGIVNKRNESEFRITLDEQADYELLTLVYDALYKEDEIIDVAAALQFIKKNGLDKINAHVQQKS